MNIIPLKVNLLAVFSFALLFITSCSKDSDLLSESILTEPEIAIDEGEPAIEEAITEEGFEIRSFAFSPINDAYLQDNQGYDQSIIRLQENRRTSYLMFDLSAVNGTIKDVVLQFSIDMDEGDGNINIHKGNSIDWTEENLTEINAPGLDTQVGSLNKSYKIGSDEKVALNAAVIQAELTTLVMSHNTGNDLAIASKEHPQDKGPKLIVTYEAPAGSPEITQEEEVLEEEEEEEEEAPQEAEIIEEENSEPENENRAVPEGYFVTVNGNAGNDGRSEATAWNIEYAFERAVAGDIVYVKAGNYGNLQLEPENSGNPSNPVKFIGYTNTPGDIVSQNGSTFSYGDNVDANVMPLLISAPENQRTAITVHEPYVHLENFQITKYSSGVMVHSPANNFTAKNLIVVEMGTQYNYDAYDGWGLNIRSKNATLNDCFVLNAAAEAIKLYDSDYSKASHCSVYADNASNPTDYYFLVAGGTNNAILENCRAERKSGLKHGGHGFNIKNDGTYNTFKNCTAVNTAFELTYVGVHHNTIDGGSILGDHEWSSVMSIIGGAHDNLIKDLFIKDTWTAITLATYNDRHGADAALGVNNTFENVTVQNTDRILNVGGGTNIYAKAKGYTFKNCDFSNFKFLAVVLYSAEDFKFENCSFDNGEYSVNRVDSYAPNNTFESSWTNCTWSNIQFTPPN